MNWLRTRSSTRLSSHVAETVIRIIFLNVCLINSVVRASRCLSTLNYARLARSLKGGKRFFEIIQIDSKSLENVLRLAVRVSAGVTVEALFLILLRHLSGCVTVSITASSATDRHWVGYSKLRFIKYIKDSDSIAKIIIIYFRHQTQNCSNL